MNIVSVVLVHAHTLFREGLRYCLDALPEFRIVGEASNGQQAIQVVASTDADLVIMEMDLPGVSGLEVSRAMKRNHPHMSIVLLSPSTDSQYVLKAIRAGVAAFLPITTSWDNLLPVLRQVVEGHYPINDLVLSQPNVAAEVLANFRQLTMEGENSQIYSPLSPRELQVLELVATDQSNKEIASLLDISNQTVKNHISSILRKLAVNDRTQAVVYAIRQGWIKGVLPDQSIMN